MWYLWQASICLDIDSGTYIFLCIVYIHGCKIILKTLCFPCRGFPRQRYRIENSMPKYVSVSKTDLEALNTAKELYWAGNSGFRYQSVQEFLTCHQFLYPKARNYIELIYVEYITLIPMLWYHPTRWSPLQRTESVLTYKLIVIFTHSWFRICNWYNKRLKCGFARIIHSVLDVETLKLMCA